MRALILIALIFTIMSNTTIGIAQAEKKIIINLASRALGLYEGNKRLELYPLGVGKVSTPTPVGYYKILTKEIDPPWIDPSNPEYEVPSGANNPLGYRWMQIHGNYGIHGTNRPDSIGFYVSNGCIRMREADVEALFDAVEVGTPVEITYNRVVVEKAADDRVAFYIYPDGYGRQALDVNYVNSWLKPWGVSAFVEDREISEAIKRSDGEPIYIGKVYSLEFEDKVVPTTEQNKRHFDNKVVERGGITYLPAVPIAIAMEMKLEWRHHTTLATKYGEVPGIEKKGQLYINEDDAGILFKVESWREGNVYKLKRMPEDEVFNINAPDGSQTGTETEPKGNDNKPAPANAPDVENNNPTTTEPKTENNNADINSPKSEEETKITNESKKEDENKSNSKNKKKERKNKDNKSRESNRSVDQLKGDEI